MCGIVGIAGDLFHREEKTMQHLFLLDYLRGMDSTGLAAVRLNGDVKIAKLASDPITLFQMGQFKETLNGNNSKLFLGHNRASTSGGTNNFNSHPFQYGHITGVQNGTLEYSDKALLEDVVGEKFNVDTQALYASIAKIGVKDTIEMIQEGDGARGAWALVWYDQKEDTLNFLRNQHRPMWLAWDEGFKRLFFASQWQFINHACETTHPTPYKLEQYARKDDPQSFYRFFSLPENQHIKFDLDELRKGSKERPKPLAHIIKGKEPKKAVSNYKPPVWDPFQRNGNPVGFNSKPTSPTSTTKSLRGSDRDGNGIFHLFGTDAAPYAHALGLLRFHELIQIGSNGNQLGCSWCYKDIQYGDPGITVYDGQDTILCASCSGHREEDETIPAAKVYVDSTLYSNLQKAA